MQTKYPPPIILAFCSLPTLDRMKKNTNTEDAFEQVIRTRLGAYRFRQQGRKKKKKNLTDGIKT